MISSNAVFNENSSCRENTRVSSSLHCHSFAVFLPLMPQPDGVAGEGFPADPATEGALAPVNSGYVEGQVLCS